MAFVSAPDCAEAVINYSNDAGFMANVLNFHKTGGYTQTDIDALATAVDDEVATNFLPLINVSTTYVNTHVRGLESAVDLESIVDTGTDVGSASGTSMPNNATFVLSFRTGFTGRSARGRMYVPPMGDSALTTANVVNSTFRNAWLTAIGSLFSAAAIAGWDAVVISRQNAGVPLSPAVAREITQIVVTDDNIDSQRRRLKGRGT